MLNRDGLFAKREDATRKETVVPSYPPNGNGSHNLGNVRQPPTDDGIKTLPATPTPDLKPLAVSEGSKLIVGPNIKLKGVEISDCDVLIVEGHVEATVSSRALHIAQPGTFNGQANIEEAEIQGEFVGDLIARKRLVIKATGKVSGKIRYGKLVIEEGGELSGDVRTANGSHSDTELPGATAISQKAPPIPAHH